MNELKAVFREKSANRIRPLTRAGKRFYLVCWLLLPLSMGLIILARQFPGAVEQYYSLGFYQWWAGIISTITSKVPFSLGEWVIIFGALLSAVFIVWSVKEIIHCRWERGLLLRRFLLRAGAAASMVLFLFTLSGGLNYYRYTFTHYSGLQVKESSVALLAALCEELVEEANTLRAQLREDENGVYTFGPKTPWELSAEATASYRSLVEDKPEWTELFALGGRVRPKPVFFSEAMSYMQIVGVFFPYTIEANVNIHTSDMDVPHAMCHELSHITGFMREDEANFIAYLACRASSSLDFRYSGVITALIYSTNALYGYDAQRYHEIMSGLSQQVQKDLEEDSAYYRAHKSTFGEFSHKVNDVYLKVNNQSDGTASYGRMVDLLLADYRTRHGLE